MLKKPPSKPYEEDLTSSVNSNNLLFQSKNYKVRISIEIGFSRRLFVAGLFDTGRSLNLIQVGDLSRSGL